jgi:general secretion pathway protein F
MPAFEYKALDKSGTAQKGVIDADTLRQARALVREKGLFPTDVSAVADKEKKVQSSGLSLFKPKVPVADLALVTRQVATLVAASLPIEEALKAVAQQTEKPRLGSMLMAVRSRVVEGYTLADSMADYPHVFDELFVAMVASGEKSGHLDVVLNRLADYTEKRHKLSMKIMQAMIYPIVLTLVAVSVISILLVSVVPQVVGQLSQAGQELPFSTQILIGLSEFISSYGVFVLGLLFVGALIAKQALNKPANRLLFDNFLLSVPILGKVAKSLNTSRFARTLSILTASSVPLLEAMRIASDVLVNRQVKKSVLEAAGHVREGVSLFASLKQTQLFPPMMLYMIASGEKSGELEQMLERAADTQDNDFEAKVTMALGVFEPMLVVSMAGIVLFIVMAILQPIMAMNSMF